MEQKETVDYHIKATWHSLARMYNQIASEYEMSQTIGYVLINIEREGTPATKIAPLMGMEPTSLSRLLKTLEDDGLIYRQGDESDKRVVRIFLTTEGLTKKRIALNVIGQFNELVRKNIKKSDLAVFLKVIERINELTNEFKPDHESVYNAATHTPHATAIKPELDDVIAEIKSKILPAWANPKRKHDVPIEIKPRSK